MNNINANLRVTYPVSGCNGSNIEWPKNEEEGRRGTRPGVVEIGGNDDQS
jgi:hypothetical protein